MPSSPFTFESLIQWSEQRLSWQQDALRRVLAGRLNESDVSDLAAMAKAEYGLATSIRPSPATTGHIPSGSISSPPVAITPGIQSP